MKRYCVDINTRGKTGPKVTIRLQAGGIQEAVQRARTFLREATEPADVDRLEDLVYQVVELETDRHVPVRVVSSPDAVTEPDLTPIDADLPQRLTPDDVQARMSQQSGHSNRVYVKGGGMADKPGLSRSEPPIDSGHRPRSDVRRTLDQPPRWTRQMSPDSSAQDRPAIRGKHLKPIERTRRNDGVANTMARGQYEAVNTWVEPDEALVALASHQVSMAWDHIHCQAIQALLPLDGRASFVVIAALGELQETIVGCHIQLPETLQTTLDGSRQPTSVQVEEARVLYEFRNGAISTLTAHAVLWIPIVVIDEVVAIVLAINPKDAEEFGYGDLKGAGYLASSFATALAVHAEA
jgi:hypothetical protein